MAHPSQIPCSSQIWELFDLLRFTKPSQISEEIYEGSISQAQPLKYCNRYIFETFLSEMILSKNMNWVHYLNVEYNNNN